jgi:hypothetical protein
LASTDPSVGTNILPDSEFVNSTTPSSYNTPGPIGIYRIDYEWSPYTMDLEVSARACGESTTGSSTTQESSTSTTQAGTTGQVVEHHDTGVTVVGLTVPLVCIGAIVVLILAIYIYYSRGTITNYTKILKKKRKHKKTKTPDFSNETIAINWAPAR